MKFMKCLKCVVSIASCVIVAIMNPFEAVATPYDVNYNGTRSTAEASLRWDDKKANGITEDKFEQLDLYANVVVYPFSKLNGNGYWLPSATKNQTKKYKRASVSATESSKSAKGFHYFTTDKKGKGLIYGKYYGTITNRPFTY